mgnify:CR=1 FL=1
MSLTTGYHPVPDGHVAAVVTHLEMTRRQMLDAPALPHGTTIAQEQMDNDAYRALFRAIGAPWLWSSRLLMSDSDLAAILTDAAVETWSVRQGEAPIGWLHLEFRTSHVCELAVFGSVQDATGQRLGLPMIAFAQARAFAKPIDRFHVHTCTLDAPQALPFYQKVGFTAYKREIEIMPDPRIMDTLPMSAAKHIPCIR